MDDKEYISKDAFIAQQRKQYCANCERRKGTKNGKRIFVYEIGETPCRACDIEDMIDAVWDFPPADVTPIVHGHWIEQTVSNGRDSWQCSICGRRARGKRENLPYCHCGAIMDEREVNNNGK